MRPIFLATAFLCFGAVIIGLTLGQKRSKLSETDVINAFAEDYARGTGRPVTDCVARPHPQENIWLVVKCGTAGKQRKYFADTLGRTLVPPLLGPET